MLRLAFFSCLLFLLASPLAAQVSFQKKLSVFLDSALIRCTPDGQAVYLASTVVQNGQSRLHLLKLDAAGNLLWHRQHISTNVNMSLCDAVPVSDGVVIAVSTRYGPGSGLVQKFDAAGQPVWGQRVGVPGRTRLFELEKDAQENLYLSGLSLPDPTAESAYYFLLYLDPGGNLLNGTKSRHHYFNHGTDEIYQLSNLSWNPAAATLTAVEDFRGPYTNSYISSPNRGASSTGHTHDNQDYSEHMWNLEFQALRATADRLAFSGQTVYLHPGIPAIGLLSGAGKVMTVLKIVPNVMVPIHSHNTDLLFYDPQSNTVTQYDTLLNPLWSKKFDNCSETTDFDGDIALGGNLFTVRTISGRTVVNKILPGGLLPNCPPYAAPAPPNQPLNDLAVGDIGAIGGVPCPLLRADSALLFTLQTTTTTDFCVRLDASFLLPDSICLGADIPLTGVDTTAGLSHGWQFGGTHSGAVVPVLEFPGTGVFQVAHLVTNPVCTDTASRWIHVIPSPQLFLEDTLVCGPAAFSVDLTQAAATQYRLDGQPVAPQLTLTQSGVYHIEVANAQCSDEATIEVKIVEFPWPLAEPDTSLCGGEPYALAFAPGFEAILWDGQAQPDTFLILDGSTHTYQATYSADRACVIHGAVRVPRTACSSELLYIPNTFSPNGDNVNDFFEISPTADAEVLELSLYDRWGAHLFQTKTPGSHWDGNFRGKALPPGVYLYRVQYRNKLTDEVQVKVGDVTLLR